MNILIACEESQRVCKEFRKLGHLAFSCDILPCSGGHPEWHFQTDVIELIYKKAKGDNSKYSDYSTVWDMMIAFPPCSHLCVSGNRHFKEKRKDGRQQEGIDFFMKLVKAPIRHIAIENPVGIMSTIYREPDQIIQPWHHGHGETKSTCLWLKNLPMIRPTNIVEGREPNILNMKTKGKKETRSQLRSKTYPGIAQAMAKTWGNESKLFYQNELWTK